MGTQSTKAKQSSRKKTNKRKSGVMATCPVGSGGWCSYPFSVAQLEKRMKAKAAAQEAAAEELESPSSGRRSK
jgi:hypothetical protein